MLVPRDRNPTDFSGPGIGRVSDRRTVTPAPAVAAFDPTSIGANFIHGALYYLPILIVTFAVGGNIEAIFAVVRKHEINEGFLVSGMLFPLTLPPTIPLWQVAIGIAFGVFVGKEIFGGTGKNMLQPGADRRASFLFFAYPAVHLGRQGVDRGADLDRRRTPEPRGSARAAEGGQAVFEPGRISWWDAGLHGLHAGFDG